ncbi:hypothetical protein ACB092_03G021300 [Castanea dentata]
MINHLPMSLLSKMGNYEIKIHGEKVKVSLIDDTAIVVAKIDELKSLSQTQQNPIVGLDIKFIKFGKHSYIGKILVLCVGTRCLIIQYQRLLSFTDTMAQFLSDETICFLGTGMSKIVKELYRHKYFLSDTGEVPVNCKTGVEIGYLAAKVLKKADTEKSNLVSLAKEVGMDIEEPFCRCPDWSAIVFSDEEIKYAVYNAYTSYVIGNKLLGML